MRDELFIKKAQMLVFSNSPIKLLVTGNCLSPGIGGACLENANSIKRFFKQHRLYDSDDLIGKIGIIEHDGMAGCNIKLVDLK